MTFGGTGSSGVHNETEEVNMSIKSMWEVLVDSFLSFLGDISELWTEMSKSKVFRYGVAFAVALLAISVLKAFVFFALGILTFSFAQKNGVTLNGLRSWVQTGEMKLAPEAAVDESNLPVEEVNVNIIEGMYRRGNGAGTHD